ncbi:restriction endonuclease subunit S [Pediococcus acidilactici]|uniref:restriction endonuclease subunit S n=1 Tax=Pediococcus acidilactici TaxID=1254 RepID=UPI001330FF22|nr:restriction endonuclease subunit S [Pediococcus acidilactici]KAF0489428.1 restriction endonuclease subunit S [Pediococcus acidilactici]
MSEEKNVPNIRFKGFTDPWEQRKLGECLNVNSGKDYKSLKRGNIPVYGTGGYMCSVDQALSYNEDAIGIGRKGTINKPYILKAPFWTVDTLFYIVPKAKLNLFFMYLIFQKVNWKRKDESTGVPSLSKSIIKSVKELFPKGREQNEIAELFEILDTTIALHQQKVTQLKELKKLLMQKIFDQEWRFRGFTDPWEQRKLGNVGEVHSGVGFPEIEQGGTEGIAFYKVSDMNIVGNESVMKKAHNYVNTEQIEKRNWKIIKHVPAIIFAKVGAAIMLNRKRIVQSPFLIDNNIMTYIFDKSWDVFFGKTLFDTINLPKYAQTGALPSYNASDIKNIKVLIPNKNLQTKIGVLFKKIDTTIALHQQKVDQLKELKKYLMQNLFV